MKIIYACICLAFITTKAQVLHHEMISSQGISATLPSGMTITQTIGQSSIIGTISSGYISGGQGFQQMALSSLIDNPFLSNISVFPNPFTGYVTIALPGVTKGSLIPIYLFDLQGRLVYAGSHTVQNETITVHLETLPNAVYLLTIKTKTISNTIKLIKH